MTEGDIWSRLPHDPRNPQHAGLRSSDRDRDVVRDLLSEAYADGRLTREELEERTERLDRSRTLGELPALVEDLVAPSAAPVARSDFHADAVRRYRSARQQALYGFLTPTLVCWIVWAATMFGGFPWPAIVTVVTSLRWLQLVLGRDDAIADIEARLQSRERKRVARRERRQLERGETDD